MQITIELPEAINLRVRGADRSVPASRFSATIWAEAAERGFNAIVQANLGDKFEKGEKADTEAGGAKLDAALAEIFANLEQGILSTGPGRGRTADPLTAAMRGIAEGEVNANIEALLAFHGGITKSEFDKTWKAKYVSDRIAKDSKHYDRIKREAERQLSKAKGEVKKSEGKDLADF